MENILRECAERLITAANGLSGSSTSSNAQQTSVVNVQLQEQASTTTTAASRPSVAPSALEEHGRIFGYRPPVGAVRRPLQASRATKARGRPYLFVPKNTFTRAFVCLANTDQVSAPTASERIRLTMAGLGEAKVVFNKDGNAQHVHGKILETFPALSGAGGYEILRMSEGNTRQFIEIPCPSKGFTVQCLKSALGQAKAFLRPIQKNLDLDVQATCGEQVIITQVRIHQRNCTIAQEQPDVASDSNVVSDTNVASSGNDGSIHSLQLPDHVGSDHCSQASESLTELNALFPQESEESIREVLMESGGDAGRTPGTSSGASNTRDDLGEDDMDLLQSPFSVETNGADSAVRYRRRFLKPTAGVASSRLRLHLGF
ncbi:hypothetical protein OS493_000767 [Desmophyllum pertusum]|uniref:Uncharacterized protein n=1 Tax=Desmophyllum pertusum TaxID=174260 RepID=A0A9X0A7U2_9CNID|nr:hypothetical protein OS493_000767 [Desmophyllum pertusum]